MKIIELIRDNYRTYKNVSNGIQERHWVRLLGVFLISLLLAVFSSDPSGAYPIMVTGITILTGFTFTALFSNHILGDVGLPKPVNESDRLDLQRLAVLSKNFKARSSYFISISIIDAVLLIAASLNFSTPKTISHAFSKYINCVSLYFGVNLHEFSSFLLNVFPEVIFIIVVFLFLECLYTFFRLSETIIAIVEIRSNYIKAAESRE